MDPIRTTDGHYEVRKKGKWWYYYPADKTKPQMETGPHFSVADALEAAQHFENEYHRHKKPA